MNFILISTQKTAMLLVAKNVERYIEIHEEKKTRNTERETKKNCLRGKGNIGKKTKKKYILIIPNIKKEIM